MRRIDGMNFDDGYPVLSDAAPYWLSAPWWSPGFKSMEGLYCKPHLYYA